MLKNIRLHIDADEQKQAQIEASMSLQIQQNQRDSINAFRRYIPTLVERIRSISNSHISVFCNSNAELNIVDYNSGRAFYGFYPKREVNSQLNNSSASALKVDLQTGKVGFSAIPEKVEALVVFGLGAGYHIAELLQRFDIEHLIIYEPEEQYFKCAISMQSWSPILEMAQRKGTGIYFQLGQDGRDVYADLAELQANTSCKHCFFIKHYNHPVFDAVLMKIREDEYKEVSSLPIDALQGESRENIVPKWAAPIDTADWDDAKLSEQTFERNLSAFKSFFPEIHKEFCDYKPKYWSAKANESAEVNLFHNKKQVNLYGDSPIDECNQSLAAFAKYPHKDGLILGYKGKKLSRFIHYKMVKKIEPLLEKLEDEQGELPNKIKSMIVFGIGIGYQLETLVNDYDVEKLFICEPNRDFFYASLYAIDWYGLLHRINDSGGRLYINIGDDGTHLFEDLLIQFQTVGAYILANTYFYQGYYNEKLVAAISQLREQLQVLIAMGDYYDHARYGVAHTWNAIRKGIPNLRKNASKYLTGEDKDVPVFVVGNGPSLDGLLEIIKEYHNEVIVISCGTALQTLHRNGITPDFHAEIETNRSTFDWACRVGDFDYLKQITLISCNGIHPDTSELYGDVLLAFKEGESATVCIQEIYKDLPFAQLGFAYPTVTNFVADFIAQFRFQQVYLIGVDMGFVDDKYHHSKSSGYYTSDGKERYDYRQANNTSMIIPGNFRARIKTKYEFKVAKEVLERPLALCGDVYNLNDGAKIKGALPLIKDDVLILSSSERKNKCLSRLKTDCFEVLDAENFNIKFEKRFQHQQLLNELGVLLELVEKEISTREDADNLVEQQRDFIVSSFKHQRSLLFFYLNGTLNFVNSALMKVLAVNNEQIAFESAIQIRDLWVQAIKSIIKSVQIEPYSYDSIRSFIRSRQQACMSYHVLNSKDTFAVSNVTFNSALKDALRLWECGYAFSHLNRASIVICCDWSESVLLSKQGKKVVYIHTSVDAPSSFHVHYPNITTVYFPDLSHDPEAPADCNKVFGIKTGFIVGACHLSGYLVVPKIRIDTDYQDIKSVFNLASFKTWYMYDLPSYLVVSEYPLSMAQQSLPNGDRMSLLEMFNSDCLIAAELSMKKQKLVREQVYKLTNEKNDD